MHRQRSGNIFASFSFLLWGILPLYYYFLPSANMNELLAIRLIFSVPVMLVLIFVLRQPAISCRAIIQDKRSLLFTCIASLILCASWYSYTWAITHGQVLAASLGFFINPIFVIAFGVIFLKERLSYAQIGAVILGVCGICYQVWRSGEAPWLALFMGGSFALYGLCKKGVHYDALVSVTIESALLAPFAIIYMLWQYLHGNSVALSTDTQTFLLYIGSAPVTLAPLIFFALAVKRTSLTMLGLMQYIEPSVQFLLAVFLFGELFDMQKLVSFSFIWLGLLLCIFEMLSKEYKKKYILQS